MNVSTTHKKSCWYRKRGKRCLDLCVAIPALFVLSPLLLATYITLKLRYGGRIIFRQERPGLNEENFTIYKFKTMSDERDLQGMLLPDDIRLTALGNFLRKTSIDELPQLYNVIRGDMSIIGPRPLLISYLPLYNAEQHRRHEVLPGITGLAQIRGRNLLSWPDKFKLDVLYVDTLTFTVDVKILVATFLMVVRGTGVSQPGRATFEPFHGNE